MARVPPPPHPAAGKKGEGPPIAPVNWKWRCGNRLRDMYFYSPLGKLLRSRTELITLLSTMTDPPSADDFCWRVTPEILETGVWNKDDSSPKTPSRAAAKVAFPKVASPKGASPKAAPGTPPKEPPASAAKRKHNSVDGEKKTRARIGRGPNGAAPPQMPPPSTSANGVQFSQVEPLAIRAPGSGMSKKVTSRTARAKVKAKKGGHKADPRPVSLAPVGLSPTSTTPVGLSPTSTSPGDAPAADDKAARSHPHTFKEILTEPSSFKWLYDSDVLNKFVEDAGRLAERSKEEISELRAVLVERNLQIGNITKYPNSVLRVFVRLLSTEGLGEEPDESLGKVELADMCIRLKDVKQLDADASSQ